MRHTGAFAAVSAMDANSADDSDFRFMGEPNNKGVSYLNPGLMISQSSTLDVLIVLILLILIVFAYLIGLIFISQSGETREMTNCLQQALRRNFATIGVVNGVGSTIANHVSCGTYTFAGDEKAAPSTKSFTNEVVCLALISLWFRQVKAKEHGLKLPSQPDSLGEALQRLPITFGMAMRVRYFRLMLHLFLSSSLHRSVFIKTDTERMQEGRKETRKEGALFCSG